MQSASGGNPRVKALHRLILMAECLLMTMSLNGLEVVYETLKTSSNTDTSLLISYSLGFIPRITPFSEADLLVDIALSRWE